MATFEGMGLCAKSEYRTAFENRLQIDQLTRGELYVARFELEHYERAFRVLGRVGVTASLDGDASMLVLQLVNDKLEPIDAPYSGKIIDGVWNPFELIDYVSPKANLKKRIRDGCFRDYDDGSEIDDDELRLFLDLPAAENGMSLAGAGGDHRSM